MYVFQGQLGGSVGAGSETGRSGERSKMERSAGAWSNRN